MSGHPTVALLTDFGTVDSYVAEMKATMLRFEPRLRFIDVTHQIALGDVRSAQYLLDRTWARFPKGTVHLAVVDPGVGTSRSAIAATSHGHGFVAPDNGILSPILESAQVVQLPVPDGAAPTFHGRDVFAPAAARLAGGTPLKELGRPFTGWHSFPLPIPKPDGDALVGSVIHVDRFGTLVTNLVESDLPPRAEIHVEGTRIGPVQRTFADVEPGVLLAFVGSGATIEIAVREGSASDALGASIGTAVRANRGKRSSG